MPRWDVSVQGAAGSKHHKIFRPHGDAFFHISDRHWCAHGNTANADGFCGAESVHPQASSCLRDCHRLALIQFQCQIQRDNMGAAAHLIHGSSDGRFDITYAVKKDKITREEIEGVGFGWADYDETIAHYNPETLQYGYNVLPDGEEIYYIPNPALGLWINKEKF